LTISCIDLQSWNELAVFAQRGVKRLVGYGLKQVAEYFLRNNYKKDIAKLYKGRGGVGDISSDEPAQGCACCRIT